MFYRDRWYNYINGLVSYKAFINSCLMYMSIWMRALSYSNNSILCLFIYIGVWKEVVRYIRVISCFIRSNCSHICKVLHNIQTDKSNVQLPSSIIIVKNQTWTQQRFVPSSYEKMSFKPLCFSFAILLLIQPMVALIKSQNKNKVKCNAVVFTSTSFLFSIKRLFVRI